MSPVPPPGGVKIQDDFVRTSNSFNMSPSNGYPEFPLVWVEDETKILILKSQSQHL